MFSKFSVLPTVSKYLKGSKRLLHMSKKFAGTYCRNPGSYIYRHCGSSIPDDQPICSGSRYSLNGSANIQMRLMSFRDSKGGDKSIENKSDLKVHNEDANIDVKLVKKVIRIKSRKESRESYRKGDRFKFSSKRRRSQRELTVVPILVKSEKGMGFDFPHKQVADLLRNTDENKGIDIVKNVGISESALPPKKLHVEYIESINIKDIEIKKTPSSSGENLKRNPTTREIKRNVELASDASQLTDLYLESKNRVPIQIEKENQPESSQSGNETDAPNVRIVMNLDSIFPMGNQSNLKPSGSNDTKVSPKPTQTKPPVIVKTFKKKIRMLPLNAGQKVDTAQKTEDAKQIKSIDKYKPMGLRYTKFSKLMDRVAAWNITSLKSSENAMAGDTTTQKNPKMEILNFPEMLKPPKLNATPVSEIGAEKNAMTGDTTPQKNPKMEILNFSEMLKPPKLNATPVSEIGPEKKIPLSMIQEVKSTKHPTNITTLQKQSNIEILKLSELYNTTNFGNTADSTQIKNEPLPVAHELKTTNSNSNKTTLKEKSNSEVLKLSEIFETTTSIDKTLESVAKTKNISIPIKKYVNSKSELEPSKVLENKKSKELHRRYNDTPKTDNAIKLKSLPILTAFNSEVKPIADPNINLSNAESPKSLNTNVNSVATKLEIPSTPTYTNVKAKIERENNEIQLKRTKPPLTEPLPYTTTNRPVKTTKSDVLNFKTKTFHSNHSPHEEPIRIKPKFMSKYKRAEMFKKATEKILGRIEPAKSKTGQKGDFPIVNDLKTAAFENLSAIQHNPSTGKTLQSNSQSTKDTEIKITNDNSNLPNLELKNFKLDTGENGTIPNILNAHNTEPKTLFANSGEYKLVPKLDTNKTEPKTLSANSGEFKLLPKLDTDIFKVKKVAKVLETDIKIEKGSPNTNVVNIPSPSVDTLKAKNTPPASKINQSLNMTANKSITKSEQGNTSPPSVDDLKVKNSPPPPNKNTQSLNVDKNSNFTKSEQETSKNLTNSPLNNYDSKLKRLKVPKTNVDSPLSNHNTFNKSGEINFSTTNITQKSNLIESIKQPNADVGKGNQGPDKTYNIIIENPSKPSTNSSNIGENPTKPVTSSSIDKYHSATSPSHYPKNMFGEIISPEQLRKSQEKLKAFQAKLDVTAARPSPKTVGNQNSTTGNSKRPNKVSRPGPSKKPEDDGGSGNQGGDNTGGSGAVHDMQGHFVKFWSTATITTIYLALSVMIYLMKDLPPLNPWQRFFTSLTREQTEAILRIQPATFEKDTTISDLQDDAENKLLKEGIVVTGSIQNEDQTNTKDIGDHKIVEVDKNSKFEDV